MDADRMVRDARKMITAADITMDAKLLVRQASLPLEPDEHIDTRIRRAAQRLKLSFPQAKRLWYGERLNISAHEYLNLKNMIRGLAERDARRKELTNEMDRRINRSFPFLHGTHARRDREGS